MNNEIKTSDNTAGSLRLIGFLILIIGIILLFISQVMEITVEPDYANIDVNVAQHLPEKVANIELIANKTNFTLLGGFLMIFGMQLSLVSNKIISEIKEQFKKPL
ncbi:hypothetical protein [Flavobacterium sp.]|jgi:uncharacterized membrane protein|uniref:hypothetical protein n=1 Tax=Flavobacterium sp. TaxID=239 RepID=UPI002C7963B0|nr:hypothetical protein [Flavobacterium sp.]HSD08037.1 hypothetical protein [Flavobacterium sp.]